MTTPHNSLRRYVFGDFTLDTSRGALLKGSEEVRLRPQSFDVLRMLIERNGNLVTKEDLHKEIWANKIVTDDSITHCLLDIRKALGDTEKKFIRTVPRRGYIFDLPCTVEEIDAAINGKPKEYLWFNKGILTAAVAILAVLLAGLLNFSLRDSPAPIIDKSIAVLPFADMSETQDQQYLGDGLSDEILILLAGSDDLHVIARTSSFSFADETPDIETIRERLRVAFVLEGSVRRTGELLRVSAQLIDTSDSSNVWSESYERRAQDLLLVQNEIAEAVLWTIAPETDKSLATSAPRNFSANELMLLARYYEQQVRELPEVDEYLLGEAIRLYRDAIAADPESALAHSRLAGALLYGGDIAAAKIPTFTALKLEPNLSEVQETLGLYYWLQGLPGAGLAWKTALDLNPNNPDALAAYAYWSWMQGDSDEPPKLYRRALELDPLSLARFGALGENYAHLAMIPEALEIADRVEKLFSDAASYRLIGRLMELTGRIDESIAWTIRARDLEPDNPEHVDALAELYAEIGDFDTALALQPQPDIGLLYKMRRYQDVVDVGAINMINHPDDLELRYALAFAYNVLGNAQNAVHILRRTGLPDTVRPEARRASDIEAFVTLVDALNATGETHHARQLADWWEARKHTDNENWWIRIYRACPLAISGHDEIALELLVSVADSPRLPWESLIRDMPCFERFAADPAYQAMLQKVAARRAALRNKLPDTLRTYNVSL